MSKLKDDEPDHWHYADGRHRMPDPRPLYEPGKFKGETFEGEPVKDVPRSLWEPDERAYAEHLEAHGVGVPPEQLAVYPTPEDPQLVKDMFALIAANEATNAKMRQIIMAIRQALAQGKSIEDIKRMFPAEEASST